MRGVGGPPRASNGPEGCGPLASRLMLPLSALAMSAGTPTSATMATSRTTASTVRVTRISSRGDENNLAVVPCGHDGLVGAGGLGKRDLLADDRPERSVAEPLHERVMDAGHLRRRG